MAIWRRLVDEIAGGDDERMVRIWMEHYHEAGSSHRLRLTTLQTAGHIAAVAASEQQHPEARLDEINPVDFAEYLHSRAQLVPLIRALISDGVISLDDIDPPPATA